MGLALITCSSILFYSTSRYFPEYLDKFSGKSDKLRNGWGLLFGILGWFILSLQMDMATALVTSLVLFMVILPLLIFSLSLRPQTWLLWMTVIAGMIIKDLYNYAG